MVMGREGRGEGDGEGGREVRRWLQIAGDIGRGCHGLVLVPHAHTRMHTHLSI